MGKSIFIIFILFLSLFLFTNFVYAEGDISPDTRLYFDNLFQKVIAQTNSKIDSSTTTMEKNMRKEFQDSTYFIDAQVKGHLFKAVKILAIGLAGFMILILGLFKVLDLKITKTRLIQQYETQLQEQIKLNESYLLQLNGYRDSLIVKQKELYDKYGEKFKDSQIPLSKEFKPKKKTSKWIWFLVILLAIGLITLSFLLLPTIIPIGALNGTGLQTLTGN